VDEERIRRLENELAETGDPVVEASLRSARTEAIRLREALSSATPLEDEPHDPTVVELGDAVTAREDGSNELERSTVVGKLRPGWT
jgi:transcription elongation GreA/GreB family factor